MDMANSCKKGKLQWLHLSNAQGSLSPASYWLPERIRMPGIKPPDSQLDIGKARRVLTEDATKTVMQSLVMSRLGYCDALLIGIQQDLIAKLQRLQSSAARIVSRTRKYHFKVFGSAVMRYIYIISSIFYSNKGCTRRPQ